MASIKYKTEDGYVSIPLNIIGSRVYLEDYDDGEVIPELVDDSAKIGNGIGTCSTSSGTALEVTLDNYRLVKNGIVAVTFENDVPANATLNINNKGAKAIYNEGSAIEADVIKAGKTVMFAYDGTNYVVTSLSGVGDVELVEYLSIILTCDDQTQVSSLIGATVVVTDNDNSETILSTTWQGTTLECTINVGINYTITVGAISGGYTTPLPKTFNARAGYTRTESFIYKIDYVDLGLPSGTKWAKGNVMPTGNNTYGIGEETDHGVYLSWGNVTPHYSSNGSTFDDGYAFTSDAYSSTQGASITVTTATTDATFAPNSGYDAARQLLGGSWRMPTAAEYKELYDNCASVWTSKDGVNGREFTSNINGNKIFIPASGFCETSSIGYRGSYGNYWSSSGYNNNVAYWLVFTSNDINPLQTTGGGYGRYIGFPLRPVL